MSAATAQPLAHDLPHVEVFNEIGAVQYLVRQSVIQHLPPGMTYAHFELLNYLMRYGDGQTPAELAQVLMLTKGALTNILQKMETQGWVAVLADVSDRRKKRVRLTRTGRETQSDVLKAMKDQTGSLRESFTENEFRQALPFLKALRTFLVESVSEPVEPAVASR